MRRLIINADDFGLTTGVNRAIVEAARSGVLTSATIMANAARSAEAASLARAHPKLRIGCHVVLIDGAPVSTGAPSLTNGSGLFRSSLKDFASAALRRQLSPDDIQREAEAQILRLQSAGLTVTHIDTHKHTHIFPQVVTPLLRAARNCGIHAVRRPFEPVAAWPWGAVTGSPGLWLRCGGVLTFQCFAPSFRAALRTEGMRSTDGTVGIVATGKLDQAMLTRILTALPAGTWELVCHPGYSDVDLMETGTRLTASRDVELAALISAETKEVLARQKIELISYADL